MKCPLLLVIPTLPEAEILIKKMLFKKITQELFAHPVYGHLLISGAGIPATLLQTSQYFNRFGLPSYALHAGIAGSYRKEIEMGTVVYIQEDCIGDLGVEQINGEISVLHEMDFSEQVDFPVASQKYSPTFKHHAFHQLREVKSITLNVASGSQPTIDYRRSRFNPDIENMETAAFFMACNFHQCVNYEAIRSISNPVEPRNKDNWQIEKAINSLTNSVMLRLSSS